MGTGRTGNTERLIGVLGTPISATTTSNPKDCKSFQFPTLVLIATGTVSMNIKVHGSQGVGIGEEPIGGFVPNFASASTETNPWSYVGTYDMDSLVFAPGSTGITLASAGTYQYKINADNQDWLGITATITTGSLSAFISFADNA
jgi:hypothetical protein